MEQFKKVIRNMISLFENLEQLEQKKIEAVSKNNLVLLEEAMNKEQAEILKLRGSERELYDTQKKCGWESKTFREICLLVSEDDRKELEELFQQFSTGIERFQLANEESKKALNIQIYAINKAMQQGGTAYDDSGKLMNRKKSFTNTKI